MSKTRNTLVGTALVAAIALSLPATSALAKGGMGGMGGGAALQFEHFDQNGDGSLTREEMQDVRKAHFNMVDTNGDGELSADELKAGADARREARFARMVERLDTDGNGTISAAEMEAGKDGMRKGGKMGKDHARDGKARGDKEHAGKDRGGKRGDDTRQGRGDDRFDRMFALIDTDGDGAVSKAEFDSAKERLANRRGAAPAEN
ncbi:EF-hand domain-containing protein [Marinovum sp.]|uniref:EF-hand domain-containing protein n=1 Tax=Marinovum sp. TaxID=2024839 RepID=UPI003A93492B